MKSDRQIRDEVEAELDWDIVRNRAAANLPFIQ
jgi:hypothetical protein